jgi:hypothetical protein
VRVRYFNSTGVQVATHNSPTLPMSYLGRFGGLDYYGIASPIDFPTFTTPPADARWYTTDLQSSSTFYTDTVNRAQLTFHFDHDYQQSIPGIHFPMYNVEDTNDWFPGIIIDP